MSGTLLQSDYAFMAYVFNLIFYEKKRLNKKLSRFKSYLRRFINLTRDLRPNSLSSNISCHDILICLIFSPDRFEKFISINSRADGSILHFRTNIQLPPTCLLKGNILYDTFQRDVLSRTL
jgi:hypothetical protein